jgi:hypothetical protein
MGSNPKLGNPAQKTKDTDIDIAHRISMLKWQWAGHISHRTDNRWGKRVLEWRPRLGAMYASSRKSSEMARSWRGLSLAVNCSGLMIMMMRDGISPDHTQHILHTQFYICIYTIFPNPIPNVILERIKPF